ncbi:hypothetical protein N7478_011075 [Penicillium angulare]|uniref:uncharacterized protein n=1 Tax=Penicillium angulare TaxID=116970 RepID=UPI00254005DB|nr:uncharacterized protein N7478_011075 [Penicillium angulare]KAJ5263470.1 hypothetical protein N7478_011075 [Penicillium angulare]
MQGMFSRPLLLTLADGREVVQQFRTEPLELDAFKIAKNALGSVVPDAMALENEELFKEGVWAYSFNRIHGNLWVRGIAGKGTNGRIAINKSLGRTMSKGYIADTSDEAVDGRVRSHLEALVVSPLEDINPYRGQLQGFLDNLDQLKNLV